MGIKKQHNTQIEHEKSSVAEESLESKDILNKNKKPAISNLGNEIVPRDDLGTSALGAKIPNAEIEATLSQIESIFSDIVDNLSPEDISELGSMLSMLDVNMDIAGDMAVLLGDVPGDDSAKTIALFAIDSDGQNYDQLNSCQGEDMHISRVVSKGFLNLVMDLTHKNRIISAKSRLGNILDSGNHMDECRQRQIGMPTLSFIDNDVIVKDQIYGQLTMVNGKNSKPTVVANLDKCEIYDGTIMAKKLESAKSINLRTGLISFEMFVNNDSPVLLSVKNRTM